MSLSPQSLQNDAKSRRGWVSCYRRWTGLEDACPALASRAPLAFYLFLRRWLCVQPAMLSRDTPEEEESHWAIFHHYILHFLINEIQSKQTASLVDHRLREKITDPAQHNVKKNKWTQRRVILLQFDSMALFSGCPSPSLEVPVIPGRSKSLVVVEKRSKRSARSFSAPFPANFRHQQALYMKGRRTQLKPHHASTYSMLINS